jgi:hypothetical protein
VLLRLRAERQLVDRIYRVAKIIPRLEFVSDLTEYLANLVLDAGGAGCPSLEALQIGE